MFKQGSGSSWIVLSFSLLMLTLVSTFFLVGTGPNFFPKGNVIPWDPGHIARYRVVVVVSVTIPALSALSPVFSMFVRPRSPFRIAAASLIFVVAILAVCFCWLSGSESLEQAQSHSVPLFG
ncbi:hypothetical protein F7P69_07145 [Cellulosimicrobium funkei]|nr:hypothetical protein [Cellulosimicrobium funkei]